MKPFLKVGDTLYHKTNNTKCTIQEIADNNIKIQLENPISDKSLLLLPLKHIGEWLFFKKEDVQLTIEELSQSEEYILYGNNKICNYIKECNLTKELERQEQEKKKELKRSVSMQLTQEFEEAIKTPKKFNITKNRFLSQDTVAYYNLTYTHFGNPGNPDFLNVLKNTFDKEKQYKLHEAKLKVENIVHSALSQIINEHALENCVCVCIPRAKANKCYTANQLLFKNAIENVVDKLDYVVDGTDVFIRYKNTYTTHLDKPTQEGRIQGNDGEKPYIGITKDTCHIGQEKILNKTVILIDDIYTKTINIDEDAIQALLDNGAKEVIFYAVARTGGPYDLF